MQSGVFIWKVAWSSVSAATADQLQDQDNDGDDQQYVDKATDGGRGDKAKHLQGKRYDGEGV